MNKPACWTCTCCFICLLCAVVAPVFSRQNWDRFHGSNGSGLAESAELPTNWTDTEYLWQVKLAGMGCSSPVIWNDRLFVTSCNSQTGELKLQCFDVDSGKQLWLREFQSPPYPVHSRNNFASATPAVDADQVYISYANPDHTMLVALDHDSNEIWQRDFGTWVSQHGFSVSPIVYKEKIIFFNSQQSEQLQPGESPGTSRVIAVNRKDGSDAWTTQMTANRACYSVPCVYTDANGREQIISYDSADGFFGLDPETGKQNWAVFPFEMRTVASTLIADGLVIGSNGSGGGGNYLVAIRPDATSPTKAPEQVYTLQKSNYVPSPIAVNGLLFFFTDKGIGNCVDLQTGKLHWSERLSAGFSGSPVATSKSIYVMDEDGMVFVIAPSTQFNLLGKHPLGEPSRSTPAIGDNKIFFRTESQLFCVGNKK